MACHGQNFTVLFYWLPVVIEDSTYSLLKVTTLTIDRRKFRIQTSDNMERWKSTDSEKVRREKIRDGQDQRGRKSEERGCRCAKREESRDSLCFFPMIWGSEGSKSNLAKAAGAEPAGQMRDEKLHGVVARSTFPSQNAQNTPTSDHFWKLRCRKSARCCGAKHISKSKCTKHIMLGPLLEVAMSKKCAPPQFQVKMHKAHQLRTTFGS